MMLIWLSAAGCYGLLYGLFCMKKGRIGPGIAMLMLALCPLTLGICWAVNILSCAQM